MASTGRSKKSNPEYTLLRLSVTEKQIFIWQSLYNTACFALLLLVQIGVAIGHCWYYINSGVDASATGQTIFLAFYRNDFLHSLVPFDEPANIICNLLLTAATGLVCSRYVIIDRREERFFWMLYCTFYMGFRGFIRPVSGDGYGLFIYVFIVVAAVDTAVYLIKKETDHEDYEE